MLNATELFLFAPQLAILAWVFCRILIQPGHLLEFWGDFLDRLYQSGRPKIANPLGLCVFCFAGQLGLWCWLAGHGLDRLPGLPLFVAAVVFWVNLFHQIARVFRGKFEA